jgi:hypothetical protein
MIELAWLDFGCEGDKELQHLFRTFPRGWPAIGLFLLRAVIAITAFDESAAYFSGSQAAPISIAIGLGLALAGSLLLIGLRTSLASALFVSIKFAILFGGVGSVATASRSPRAALYAVAIAIAVALLGPGAVSLDCRLFGHREIVIPAMERRS